MSYFVGKRRFVAGCVTGLAMSAFSAAATAGGRFELVDPCLDKIVSRAVSSANSIAELNKGKVPAGVGRACIKKLGRDNDSYQRRGGASKQDVMNGIADCVTAQESFLQSRFNSSSPGNPKFMSSMTALMALMQANYVLKRSGGQMCPQMR